MNVAFEVALGTIAGQTHQRTSKNNQDALCCRVAEDTLIAVVCDGCGSHGHSEVGASLGATLVAEVIGRRIADYEQAVSGQSGLNPPEFWEQIRQELLQRLGNVVMALDGDRPCHSSVAHRAGTILDYWLFTIVGVVITPTVTTLFSLGDGTLVLNGEPIGLPAFAYNAPPYLAYGLLSPDDVHLPPDALGFQLHRQLPTAAVESLLIGTDGVQDLIAAADKPLPGKSELVGTIAQFWQEDAYFKNPDQVRRRLSLINRDVTKADWQNRTLERHSGLLPDDTTLIAIRRKRTHAA